MNKPAKSSGIFSLPWSATGTTVACILEDESSKDIKHTGTCSPLMLIISYFQSKKNNKEDRVVRKSKAEVILKRQTMSLP